MGSSRRPPGDGRVASASDVTGRARPLLWDPDAGTSDRPRLELDGDVEVLDWSSDGSELLLAVADRGEETLVRYDLTALTGHAIDLGGGSFGVDARFGPDGEIIVIRSRATRAPEVLAVGPEGVRTIVGHDGVPGGAALRSVSFPSSDGTSIQAWVGVPGTEGPYPTVLSVHGGPEGVTATGTARGSLRGSITGMPCAR